MKRKTFGYVFLACWIGITILITINKWNVPLTWWLTATFGLVGLVSGCAWIVEVA